MAIQVAIILSRTHWDSGLLKLLTGCYAYHCGFVDLEAGRFYDMNLIRRRRRWPYYAGKADVEVELYPAPGAISRQYLEDRLDDAEDVYGVQDFCLFAARPLLHLVGQPTRNAGGVICSEMVNNDLRVCGAETPWTPMQAPPSPCDLRRWLQAPQ